MSDYDYEAFGVKYRFRHFTKFRILLAVTVLLGLLLVAFVVLFAVEKLGKKEGKAVISGSGPCITKDCAYASVG